MKRDFVASLRCLSCGRSQWKVNADVENEVEIRTGALVCVPCGARHLVEKGVVDFLDPRDEGLQREVKGWIEMAGPLDENLVPTMAALPYYPHDPWPHVAPDFFQIFEHVDLAGRRVIDIGAGRTWSTRFLVTIGRAREAVALDVLTTRFLGLETAEVYFDEDRVYFERIRGDAHRMPLVDQWADVVFSCATLHHSSDLPALFAEISRVLRPGGQFIFVSEPCKKASIAARRPENAEVEHGINENIYNLREYLDPLRALGFSCRRLVPRSIRYRLVYPDKDWQDGMSPRLRRLSRTDRGRALIETVARHRWLGAMLYRYWSLPLTVIATRRT